MSLMTFLGSPGNILAEGPHQARLVKLNHPILANEDLARIRNLNVPGFACRTLPIGFPAGGTGDDLAAALSHICCQAEAAIARGECILI